MDFLDLTKRLEEASVLTALDSKQQGEVEEVLKLPGIIHIYGLMLGSKQAQLVALANAPLQDMGTVARAAVLQGTIKGIDLFHQTLLEQTVRSGEQNGVTA